MCAHLHIATHNNDAMQCIGIANNEMETAERYFVCIRLALVARYKSAETDNTAVLASNSANAR